MAADADRRHEAEAEGERHDDGGKERKVAGVAATDRCCGNHAERAEHDEDEGADAPRRPGRGCSWLPPRSPSRRRPGAGARRPKHSRPASAHDGRPNKERVAPRPAQDLEELEPVDRLIERRDVVSLRSDGHRAVPLQERGARQGLRRLGDRLRDRGGELVAARGRERHERHAREEQGRSPGAPTGRGPRPRASAPSRPGRWAWTTASTSGRARIHRAMNRDVGARSQPGAARRRPGGGRAAARPAGRSATARPCAARSA